MAKDYGKSRPEGAPPAPHPWSKASHPDSSTKADMTNDVILSRLSNQLEDVRKDIDLNYKRLYFENPMVMPMLEMLESQLEAMVKVCGVPKEFLTEEKTEIQFGMSTEDIE